MNTTVHPFPRRTGSPIARPGCATCRHFYPGSLEVEDSDEKPGECRRHAPQPLIHGVDDDPGLPHVTWPLVWDSDFCGEHAQAGMAS